MGEFHLDDPLLDQVWELLGAAGTPVVVHAGSGPVGNDFTGPGSMARLLNRFPGLVLVVAHMGMPESREFIDLAEHYDGVHLDTSMAFTDFFSEHGGYPTDLLPLLEGLEERVVCGSDFPTLPFGYADQLGWLAGLGLGDDWLRAVCWGNGARLLGIQ